MTPKEKPTKATEAEHKQKQERVQEEELKRLPKLPRGTITGHREASSHRMGIIETSNKGGKVPKRRTLEETGHDDNDGYYENSRRHYEGD